MGQMLDSVELCLDKTDLSLIDCQDSNPDCDFSKPVQYPPIIYQSDLVWDQLSANQISELLVYCKTVKTSFNLGAKLSLA